MDGKELWWVTPGYGVVLGLESWAWSLPLPHYCSGDPNYQQAAELYAVKAGVCKFLKSGATLRLVSDSMSSLFSCNKLSCKARHTRRGRMLRQISGKLLATPSAAVLLGFLQGTLMPADFYSRLGDDMPCPWDGEPSEEVLSKCEHAYPFIKWDPAALPPSPSQVSQLPQGQSWC